jgi:hypothetical protein
MAGLGSQPENGRRGDIVSNECLEKSAEPNPSSLTCSLLFYALYDRYLQTAKILQEIKTELQISVRPSQIRSSAMICVVKTNRRFNRIMVFSKR